MYLDHAATTAISPAALAAVVDDHGHLGNPSSLHGAGREARRRVEEHRERLAEALGARPSEVVLTSGGTESDNIGVLGLARGRRRADPARTRLVAAVAEHAAVLDAVDQLVEHEGFTVTWVHPDRDGVVTPAEITRALRVLRTKRATLPAKKHGNIPL